MPKNPHPVPLVEGENNFGVGLGVKRSAITLQFASELEEVIDLPVIGNPEGAVRIRHGLMPGRTQVDDAQSPVGQPDRPIMIDPGIIRTPMSQHGVHSPEQCRLHPSRLIKIEFPADATHWALYPPSPPVDDDGHVLVEDPSDLLQTCPTSVHIELALLDR